MLSAPLKSLVKEILSVSKLELKVIDDMKPISVTDILKHTCEHLYPLAEEKNITIHQQITEQIQIMGNHTLFEKALHNIVSNAVRHSPIKSNVYVTLSETLFPKELYHPSNEYPLLGVAVTVTSSPFLTSFPPLTLPPSVVST